MIAALVALALAAATAADAAPPPLEVLEAGRLEYDVEQDRVVATGGVVLRRGVVVLRAETVRYDATTGEVDAAGGVLLTEPGRTVAAQAMHALLDGGLTARDVVAFVKETPLDLSRCRTLDEARATGRNRLSFGGGEVSRDAPTPGLPDRFEVERARVTVCDCGGGPPAWEIRARSADIVPGDRAIFRWPVFYITPRFLLLETPIPVLALPAAYLPLSERQSGLLFPELFFGGTTGFGFSQPLYLTLGRSWDATITADYMFGPTTHATKGPGTSLELRWAPADEMRGQVKVSLLHSTVQEWPVGVALPPGWNRIAVSGFHQDRVSDRTFYRVEVGLIGDPLYLQDFSGDALLRGTEYRRSALSVTHRRDDLVVAAEAAYHLPLLYLASGTEARAPFGLFGTDLSTFHRLPSASVTLLPTRLAGPLQLSGTASASRFAPLRGATGDEGPNGIGPGQRGWSAAAADAGERDGAWTPPGPGGPGERLAATRALARADLRAPVTWGGALEVEPYVVGTAAGYAFETALGPRASARGVAGLALSTRVGREYGSGASRFRHELQPRLEWRGGTGTWGPGLPNYAYDELDVALPARVVLPSGDVAPQRMLSATPGGFSQLQASVRSRLVAPAGAFSSTFLELSLGQDLDLRAGSPSETWGRGALRLGWLVADVVAGFRAFGAAPATGTPKASPPSRGDAVTARSASLTALDGRGDNVHAAFLSIGAGGSPRLLAGVEPFFDPRPFAETAIALGQVGVVGRWSGATLAYDAFFYGRDIAPFTCPNGKRISTSPHVYQHQATLAWDSPCRCWKALVTAVLNECDEHPRFSFLVDFSAFAGGGIPR